MIVLQQIPIHMLSHIKFGVRQYLNILFLLHIICQKGNPYRREVHYQGIQRDQYRNSKWPDQHYMQVI
jgi:hypothetical protein